MTNLAQLTATAGTVEAYIATNLFDPVGLMYSGIDSHTNQPFARDEYEQPGFFKRLCPESADPDFRPSVDPDFDPEDVGRHLGHAYYATRHHGRCLPRHEHHLLLALASVGHKPDETLSRAAELLALRSQVPCDFTDWISDDYEKLPETVHIYARSVGVGMVGWWRDFWLLRSLTANHGQGNHE